MKDEDIDSFLHRGGGAPGAKFEKVGDHCTGTVVSYETTQQRDMEGNPKEYGDGNPMMQLVVTVQTEDVSEDDDGKRRIFLKGSKSNADTGLGALTAALDKANAPLRPGGTLSIEYVGDGPRKGSMRPPKNYRAAYSPPA